MAGCNCGYDVNGSLFPIASSTGNQGTYYEFGVLATSFTVPSNLPTSFTAGDVDANQICTLTDSEIVCADIACRSLIISSLCFVPQFCPVIIIGGTAFSSANVQQVNQDHDTYHVCASMV